MSAEDSAAPLCDAMCTVLQELAEAVAAFSDAQYASSPDGGRTGAIGAHVRHSLDHVCAFLVGIEFGVIDYDRRERGTAIERDRHTAFDAITSIQRSIRRLRTACLDRAVRVRTTLASGDLAIETRSTLTRELAFVLNHTIHHNAMMATATRRQGVSLPKNFGYAPSTIRYRQEQECVPQRLCA